MGKIRGVYYPVWGLFYLCLKFIGGRVYDDDRIKYVYVHHKDVIEALRLIFQIFSEIRYTKDEYDYLVYDYKQTDTRQDFNRLDLESFYSMNVRSLFYFYQHILRQAFKGITNEDKMIRLEHSSQFSDSEFTTLDLLMNFTFAFEQSDGSYQLKDTNGIFPELGALLVNNSLWHEILLKPDARRSDMQGSGVRHLICIHGKTRLHYLKRSSHVILQYIYNSIEKHIIQYLETIKDDLEMPNFWKTQKNNLLSHWTTLLSYMKEKLPHMAIKPAQLTVV